MITPEDILNQDILTKVLGHASPRSRASFSATCRNFRTMTALMAGDPAVDLYYRNALENEWPRSTEALGPPSAAPPAGPGARASAAERYAKQHSRSVAALEQLRAQARDIASFCAELGNASPHLSRRYGHVPAANIGMRLIDQAARPAAAGESPPRVRAGDAERAHDDIVKLLDGASPEAAGLNAARQRLGQLQVNKLSLRFAPFAEHAPQAPTRARPAATLALGSRAPRGPRRL